MIIIGEKLNSSIKSVREAVAARNADFIAELAHRQDRAGASWLDINAAMLPDERDSLVWMGETCRSASDKPLCLDSPDPAVLEYALERLGGRCMINSTTLEEERYSAMLALAQRFGLPMVALCMDDSGALPETAGQRVEIANRLCERLTGDGIPKDDIFIDPLISPVGAVETAGVDALSVVSRLSSLGVHIVCGLSNISFGLPARPYVNAAFLVAAMTAGLDAAICDPLDSRLMRLCMATEAMLGRDEYCERYIDAFREGFFTD